MLAYGASRQSPTVDEPGHLVAGLSHWQFGQFDLYRVNPPLVRLFATLPVVFADPEVSWTVYDDGPGVRSERKVREDFISLNGRRTLWYLFLGRWACIPFSVIGAYTCFIWARLLYGHASGMLAALLWCFSPTILGHGQLLTPDVGATAIGVVANFAFYQWVKEPSIRNCAIVGLSLGLALLTKGTWIILFLLWPLAWLTVRMLHRGSSTNRNTSSEAAELAVAMCIGLFLLNVGYGFEGTMTRVSDYRVVSAALGGEEEWSPDEPNQRRMAVPEVFQPLRIPLPRNYVLGIDIQKWDFERRLECYVNGCWSAGGYWWYYAYAGLIKIPLGFLLLGALALAVSFRAGWGAATISDELLLIAPGICILLFVSFQTGVNVGVRYALPALPYFFVWASKVGISVLKRDRTVTLLGAAFVTFGIVSTVSAFPHSIAYFNELVGGSKHGHRYLLDSNCDWGQELLSVERWASAHPEASPLYVATLYKYEDITEDRFEYVSSDRRLLPGWYAVSVGALHGSSGDFAAFRERRPMDRVGYTFFIFKVGPYGEAGRHE